MPDLNTPYVDASPGDLITSEKWNDMQRRIRKDIGDKTQEAVDRLTRVQAAGNADKLEGKSLSELTDELVRRAVQAIRSESGYRQLFKVLRVGEDNIIEHKLCLCPLVDVYQLDYFQVVSCEDKETYPAWATFYLHHEGEERVRYSMLSPHSTSPTSRGSLSIQPERGRRFQIPFRELLSRYHVDYDDESSLSDVENDFWQAFRSDPNDRFNEEQYCHSPWFDKCCREEKTVGEAKRNDDWKDLYIQMRPRKTINYPASALPLARAQSPGTIDNKEEVNEINLRDARLKATELVQPAPTQVQVTQYDFDTLGLTLLTDPVYPAELFDEKQPAGSLATQISGVHKELKVMVLLKV
jgi:hypothetical protein